MAEERKVDLGTKIVSAVAAMAAAFIARKLITYCLDQGRGQGAPHASGRSAGGAV